MGYCGHRYIFICCSYIEGKAEENLENHDIIIMCATREMSVSRKIWKHVPNASEIMMHLKKSYTGVIKGCVSVWVRDATMVLGTVSPVYHVLTSPLHY